MSLESLTVLRQILADVTEVEDPASLEVDDDLFKRGLSSLETVRLVLRIEERFGVEVPDDLLTRDMFHTLGSLHEVIAGLRNV